MKCKKIIYILRSVFIYPMVIIWAFNACLASGCFWKNLKIQQKLTKALEEIKSKNDELDKILGEKTQEEKIAIVNDAIIFQLGIVDADNKIGWVPAGVEEGAINWPENYLEYALDKESFTKGSWVDDWNPETEDYYYDEDKETLYIYDKGLPPKKIRHKLLPLS